MENGKKFKSPETERFINEINRIISLNEARSSSEVAKNVGKSPQEFTDLRSGKKKLQREFLELVSLKYSIDKDFVLTGNKKIDDAKNIGPLEYPYNMTEEGNSRFIDLGDGQYLMVVPMVNEYAYMGYPAGYKDPEYLETLPKHTIIVNKHHKGYYQAFEAVGESMENWTSEDMARRSIPNGSKVTGREIPKHYWTSKFHTHKFQDYIIVHNDGITIKSIAEHKVKEGIIRLSSLNPDKDLYPDFEYNLDDVKQIFNVIDVAIRRN